MNETKPYTILQDIVVYDYNNTHREPNLATATDDLHSCSSIFYVYITFTLFSFYSMKCMETFDSTCCRLPKCTSTTTPPFSLSKAPV